MAINLKKFARDILQADEDLRTLALTTISQLMPVSMNHVSELDSLCQSLETACQAKEEDVVFLARKALNHLKSIRPKVKGADEVPLPAAISGDGTKNARSPEELRKFIPSGQDVMPLATAILELGACGEKTDVEILKPFLQHVDPRVRSNTVEALERLADEKLLTELLSPLFQDPNNRVRGSIARAMGKIGYPRIVEILRTMIETNHLSMLESAVWAMSFIKGPEMVDMLIIRLMHSYEGIRLRAVKGLARHLDPRALSPLEAMLYDSDPAVAEEAAKAIATITKGNPAPVTAEFIDLDAVRDALPPAQEQAVPTPAPPPPPDETGPKKIEDLQSVAAKLLSDDDRVLIPKLDGLSPDQLREKLRTQLHSLGEHLFELIRKNKLSHDDLNKFYYDILKNQEFLKKHQEKESQKSFFSQITQTIKQKFSNKTPAISRLEESIQNTFRDMAKKALQLVRDSTISFPKDKQFLAVTQEINKRLSGS